ncbi:MAG TPA: DNA polymerase domain-containing protein [Chloroflexota bacterium]|nr:DNA polymerase domain-containing protein [Chloroflexota bacterium]
MTAERLSEAVPTTGSDRRSLLFGRDDTPGIVSVAASRHGKARVWRRVGGEVVCEEERFPNWFFLAHRELADGLPVVDLGPEALESTPSVPDGSVGLVRLRGANTFQYLVLTDQLDAVEQQIVDTIHRRHDDGSLEEPISELMYVRPVVEQYLTITGRTYYGGMTYADIRRLQFDFETTGLGVGQDRIFMVSIKDSDGFAMLLDTAEMDEAELIRRLVAIIRERDPDVIENHNIFDFDIRFLIKRAQTLGVPLPLGRDGSEFFESRDTVKIGAANQPFTRYSLAGREIIDTLHATRRYSAIQRDLRSSGLKEAARYFGIAMDDREYVDGAEIWNVFQQDPERVRRYCMDDVEEVDRLSQILLAPAFALASMVPKPFERIATAGTGQGLIEPLLVRAYVAAGHSLPIGRASGTFAGGATGLFTTGIIGNVVKADVASLYPSIMLADRIGPANDEIGAFLGLLEELTTLRLMHKRAARGEGADDARAFHDAMQSAMKVLINSFYGSLGASFALFCDTAAAERVTARGREILRLLLDELRTRGATLIEADTDGVLFSMPPHPQGGTWTHDDELALIEDVARAMPTGIQVEHDGRYRAMYSYLEKNYALLDYDSEAQQGFRQRDPVRLVGVAFRSAKTEPFIQEFLSRVIMHVLRGEFESVRALYRSTCADLRAHRVPAAALCVSMPLTKAPQTYAKAKRREEPYEVYLAAGHTGWRPGERIRYYQAKGAKKLLQPGGEPDYDADFYINRLRTTCCQRLDKAFRPEDLEALFSESEGLFDAPLATIQPLCVTDREPDTADEAEAEGLAAENQQEPALS